VVEKYDFVRRMVLPDTILTKENKTWLRENSKVIERIYVNNNYKVPFTYETEAGNRFRAGEQLTEKMNLLRKEYKQQCGQI
jgi:DNA-directed RNA polymerase specialized sigma54-like protein